MSPSAILYLCEVANSLYTLAANECIEQDMTVEDMQHVGFDDVFIEIVHKMKIQKQCRTENTKAENATENAAMAGVDQR